MENKPRRPWLKIIAVSMVVLVTAVVAGWRVFRHHLPAEISKDIHAGLAARSIQDPDARFKKFLEERYGPMSDPLNQQRAFLDYFNVDHIKALHLLVKYGPEARRPQNIAAAARWLENYRESLTPSDRAALGTHFQTPEGVVMLRRATALYNSQDVEYRGQTAPVISQLLQTISSLQAP